MIMEDLRATVCDTCRYKNKRERGEDCIVRGCIQFDGTRVVYCSGHTLGTVPPPVLEGETCRDVMIKDLEWNAHDFGEMGKFVRLEYAKNIVTGEFGGRKRICDSLRKKDDKNKV
jgi:hypothetical protein